MKKYADGGGVYTAELGQPPQDIDGASVMPMAPRRPQMPPVPPMKQPAMKRPPVKKAPPKRAPAGDGIFREGMPVPQDIDGASAPMKRYAKGGSVSASKRADGCAMRGKTKGRMI